MAGRGGGGYGGGGKDDGLPLLSDDRVGFHVQHQQHQPRGAQSSQLTKPLIYSLLVAIGPLMFGYTLGFTSPIGKVLESPSSEGGVGLSSDQNSLFGSIVNVGAMIGAILGGYLTDKIGRRGAIQVACLPFICGFLLVEFGKSAGMLIFGRVFSGIGVGLVSLAVPLYIAEISPPQYRGGLGSINQLAITIGILVCYAIGMGVKWRPLALIGAIMSGVLLAISFLLPRTPRWLMMHGHADEARASLRRLRSPDADIDTEMASIEESIEEAKRTAGSATIGDLFRGASGRAMVVAVCLMLFQQFSGINAVFFFCQSIFEDAGMSSPDVSALSASAVQVIVTMISCFLVDRAGRRALLMVAGIGMSASAAVLGYYFFEKTHDNAIAGPVALVAVLLYITFFSLGLGAIPWLMMSEIFPAQVRGMASSAAVLLNWSCSFTVTETFESMKSNLTEEGTFWFYSAVCAAGVMYVLLFAPETKGRTLEQIEAFFQGHRSASGGNDGAGSGVDLVKVTALLCLLAVGLVIAITSI
eukprot:m.78958 g.78958  ORF g.78958 m.78958 type:complete len:528 (-) comp14770_c0_seq2:332-1915(-)